MSKKTKREFKSIYGKKIFYILIDGITNKKIPIVCQESTFKDYILNKMDKRIIILEYQ